MVDLKSSIFFDINAPALIIAEIGNNHNGSFEAAIRLIDLAKDAGADVVKFQIRSQSHLYKELLPGESDDLGTEYIKELLLKFELSRQDHQKLKKYCDEKNITYLCTPWDVPTVDFLESLSVKCYKVASADLTNFELIDRLIQTKKPLILSTGMSEQVEIEWAIRRLNESRSKFCLLHCNSTYPAQPIDINLNYMTSLLKLHDKVGYSGHERGIYISVAAAAMGAKIIERHITLDRSMEGPDHLASLEPSEFKEMVSGIREIESALGEKNITHRTLSQGELINRENLSKSIISVRDIEKGEIINIQDVTLRSPGKGLRPVKISELVGQKAKRSIQKNGFFYDSDITGTEYVHKSFELPIDWGVPVRYHDFKFFNQLKMPLVEFHLSYSDLDLSVKDYLTKTNKYAVVHAPELFENSELLDLMSPDEGYRRRSVDNLKRTVDTALEILTYFHKQSSIEIVTNCGGFSSDAFLTASECTVRMKNFEKSLNEIDMGMCRIIPQNMAPFPWHFGGQRYQNIFMHPQNIVNLCKIHGLKICLDISHGAMYCNQFGFNFDEYIDLLWPYTSHIHVADAKGVNGEGIQIGDGTTNFNHFIKKLTSEHSGKSMIPEIWQGHKDSGSGFWKALHQLERMSKCQ